MTTLFARTRSVISALLCALVILEAATAANPANAQPQQSAPPAATSPHPTPFVDPDAGAANEQKLLRAGPRIEGTILIPDERASVLIQPAGRTWRYFHEVL